MDGMKKRYIGGEAEVIISDVVEKIRKPKRYRIPEIDEELRKKRTRSEARIMSMARRIGVATPIVLDVEGDKIVMERVKGEAVKNVMNEEIARKIGEAVAKLHKAGIVHGDITPMNMIYNNGKLYFLDFGLAFHTHDIEAKGVDIHVFFESLKASFENWEKLKNAFIEGYSIYEKSKEVLERVKEIEERGRYIDRSDRYDVNK